MSTVQNILDGSDMTFAPRDVLALLAYVVDCGGSTTETLIAVATDLGLIAPAPYNPEAHGEFEAVPGEPIHAYSAPLLGALTIGRERLQARYAVRKH